MIPLSCREAWHRYGSTYIGYQYDGNICPAYIEDCNSDVGTLFLQIYRNQDGDTSHNRVDFEDSVLDYSFPTMGYAQKGSRGFYVSRRSGREYKRGIILDHLGVRANDDKPARGSRELLWEMYNPRYYSFAEALHFIKKDARREAVISPEFCLYKIPNVKEVLFADRGTRAGIVRDDTVFVPPDRDYLFYELTDMGIPTEIINGQRS